MIELAVKENGGPVFHLTNYVPKDMPKVTGFAAQVAEVEVDPTTGGVKVLNLTTAHDTGTVLNHLTLTGQIEGGIVTGFGFALMEENPMVDGKIATLTLGEVEVAVHRRRAAVEDGIGREPHRADALRRQSDRRESQRADGGGDSQCHRRCLRRAAVRAAADSGENLLGDESEEELTAKLVLSEAKELKAHSRK